MRLCIFTGSRGEWGYLAPILDHIRECEKAISTELVVTNMHLLPEYGYSLDEIERDGYFAKHSIQVFGTSQSRFATVSAMGKIISSLSDIFFHADFDYLIIAGDRFESLAAATAAFYAEVPVAHIQAGERSGNKDDAARHAIARLASLHFAANKDAADRLIRSGEEEWRVFNTGAPQIDGIQKFQAHARARSRECLCVLHPETLGIDNVVEIVPLLDFLTEEGFHVHCVYPNSDTGSSKISDAIVGYQSARVTKYRNLPRGKYLTLLANVEFLIGNSSSAILEAPTYKTPAINIGARQRGRVQGANVINVPSTSRADLATALKTLNSDEYQKRLSECQNPYGDGKSAERIVDILQSRVADQKLISKELTF